MKKWIAITSVAVAIVGFAAYWSISNSDPCSIIGSSTDKVYHQPTCEMAKELPIKTGVCFDSAQEAEKNGYMPCEHEKNLLKK